jgi:hypothetical protein
VIRRAYQGLFELTPPLVVRHNIVFPAALHLYIPTNPLKTKSQRTEQTFHIPVKQIIHSMRNELPVLHQKGGSRLSKLVCKYALNVINLREFCAFARHPGESRGP